MNEFPPPPVALGVPSLGDADGELLGVEEGLPEAVPSLGELDADELGELDTDEDGVFEGVPSDGPPVALGVPSEGDDEADDDGVPSDGLDDAVPSDGEELAELDGVPSDGELEAEAPDGELDGLDDGLPRIVCAHRMLRSCKPRATRASMVACAGGLAPPMVTVNSVKIAASADSASSPISLLCSLARTASTCAPV